MGGKPRSMKTYTWTDPGGTAHTVIDPEVHDVGHGPKAIQCAACKGRSAVKIGPKKNLLCAACGGAYWAPVGLSHLAEPVLSQLVGEFLLTYFRSMHRGSVSLHVIPEYAFPMSGNYRGRVDWAIYDSAKRRVVGLFELVRSRQQWREKRPFLKHLRADIDRGATPHVQHVGAVIPASLEAHVATWASVNGIEVVTYPD